MFNHNVHPRKFRAHHGWLAALTIAAMLATAPAGAQQSGAGTSHINLASNQYGATQAVTIDVNKSIVLDLPGDVAEVIVSQPAVAGAIMRTTRRAIIQGIEAGDTNIIFLDSAGRMVSVIDASVSAGASNVATTLETTLRRILPGSNIAVESVVLNRGGYTETNRVVLSGTAVSSDDADKALTIAAQFAGGPNNVASVISVTGAQQVMLQVTVSEVTRDVAKQLGINLSGTLSVGSANFGFNSQQTSMANGASAEFGVGNMKIDAAIRALEGRGALRILAQPTLTALSGEVAKFLAGGEVPYRTTDNDGNASIYFKPYGVELEFTPTVKSNGMIGLKVDTSVSEPQADSALTSRQASSTVELPAGTTLAIGGLLEERVRQQIDQLPGLGNIPILGALFRSRDYQTSQTELVILVTPYLIEGTRGPVEVPTDRSVVASDAEAVFLGHLESIYGVGDNAGMRGGFSGSVGFVLD